MSLPAERQTLYSLVVGREIHNVTGRKRTPRGYVALCVKTHPNCDVQGYVMEHRILMESYLGRYLTADEVVHHKNEVKHDNRLGNLEVMNHGKHTAMHHTGMKRSEETKNKLSEWAKERLQEKENHPNYKFIDKDKLIEVLGEHGVTKTSVAFGVTKKTIYNKIKEFNLEEWYQNVK